MRTTFVLLFIGTFASIVHTDDNGLLLTPPMGWMSWAKYACEINCTLYPNECINEQLYKEMIDRIAEDGYLQLGYNQVNIDDWFVFKNEKILFYTFNLTNIVKQLVREAPRPKD